MGLVDRILTIVITATITSAVWIVAGGSLIENATGDSQRNSTNPAEAAAFGRAGRQRVSEAFSQEFMVNRLHAIMGL